MVIFTDEEVVVLKEHPPCLPQLEKYTSRKKVCDRLLTDLQQRIKSFITQLAKTGEASTVALEYHANIELIIDLILTWEIEKTQERAPRPIFIPEEVDVVMYVLQKLLAQSIDFEFEFRVSSLESY